MIKLNNVCNANPTGNYLTFSFDMMRIAASFSGHALSVKVQTNSRLKFPKKIIGDGFYERRKFTFGFYCKGDNLRVKQLCVIVMNQPGGIGEKMFCREFY